MTTANRLPPELLHDPPQGQTLDSTEASRLVERMAGRLVALGMPRMPARVFFTIMTSPDGALTAAEIAERLSVSPAAVSKAVQYLIQVHFIHREYVPGSRRDLYRATTEYMSELVRSREQLIKVLCDDLGEATALVGGTDTPIGARLSDLREFFQFITEENATIYERFERWRAERAQS
jgi:predicted transcriptional regulator